MADDKDESGDAKPARREDGTFSEGSSGNLKGRPAESPRIPHPDTWRDIVYDVAEFKITGTIKGKARKLSLYHANIMTLALAGASGDKRCAEKFISTVQAASDQELQVMRELLKRVESVEPLYLRETDPVRRAARYKEWKYVVAEAMGRRERSTPKFPSGRKRVSKK